MRLVRLFTRLRGGRHLCLLLAACLMAAPFTASAAEQAVEAAAAEHCMADDLHPGDHGHSDAGGAHHAHGCGACHLHMLNVRAAAPAGLCAAPAGHGRAVMQAPKQRPLEGLFRPPRL